MKNKTRKMISSVLAFVLSICMMLPVMGGVTLVAKAADNKDVKLEKLNNNEFMDWLEGLDSFTIEENSEEILSVYYGNTDTTSEAKKNSDKQSEK